MTEEDGGAPFQLVGDITIASCQLNSEDQVAVAIAEDRALNSLFGVYVEAVQMTCDCDGEAAELGTQIILSPADARRIAAALLNAADHVDGTTPLCFYERPPEDM